MFLFFLEIDIRFTDEDGDDKDDPGEDGEEDEEPLQSLNDTYEKQGTDFSQ